MPFTPSHAVVALPFLRTPLVPAAIAIGAMTPDLPLFVRGVGLGYGFTHDDGNIVWTTLIALGLFLVWRVLLRPAVAELSPEWLSRRLPAEWDRSPVAALQDALGVGGRRFYALLLVISLMLGVISHIFWDLFTHDGRAGVSWLPALDAMWGPLPGFKWLQHGSSLLGLVVLAIAGIIWLQRTPARSPRRRMLPAGVRFAWWASLPVILVAALGWGIAAFGPIDAAFTVQHLAYRVLPPACAIWGAISLLLCVVIVIRRARR